MWRKILQAVGGSRLRNRFVLFFVILATVPVLVLGGTTLYFIDLSHRYDVSTLELQLIDQKIKEMEKFFSNTLGILDLSLAAIGDQDEQEEPEEQIPYSPEKELQEVDLLLDNMREANPAFEELSFINRQGQEISRSPRLEQEDSLQNVSELTKFKEALEGEKFISDVHYTLSGPAVTMSAPVRNLKGDIVRILSAEVSLSEVVKSVTNDRLGTSGYLVLVDKVGRIIAYGGQEGINQGKDISGSLRVTRVLSGETLTGLSPNDRYNSLFSSVAVVGAAKIIPKTGWGVMVEWPANEADALIGVVRNQILLLTLFSVLSVIFISPLFANSLIRPIRKLKIGALEIEKGNFEIEVDIRTKDELEELGKAFNRMRKGLKRLEELRKEFVFIAAHELRAPVTVIKGYLSMVLEGSSGPVRKKTKTFLIQVEQANQRLSKLVDDLLEVARSEAGKIVIDVAPIDIREPTKKTIEGFSQLAKEKSITLKYEIDGKIPEILADKSRIGEIMENLVGNAIKYTPAKGHVRVGHEVSDENLITHVKDDGFGIPEKAQSKLFEKFYRVKTEETRDITGTGLGLFIVKSIVEKMNGKIWFSSKEGQGTTFSFSLPIVKK